MEQLRSLSHFENYFVTKESHLPAIFGHQKVFAGADVLLTGDSLEHSIIAQRAEAGFHGTAHMDPGNQEPSRVFLLGRKVKVFGAALPSVCDNL